MSGPPKQQLVGRFAGTGMSFQHAARGREHVIIGPGPAHFPAVGGDDVAIGVEAHAVDAAMHAACVLAPGE